MPHGRRCIEVEVGLPVFWGKRWYVTVLLLGHSVTACDLIRGYSPLIFLSTWRPPRMIFWHIFRWTVLCQLLFSVEYFSTPFTVKLSCEGKVDITIEILVNSKAALELAIRVSHIFTSDVVDPWEETTMVLSVDLVFLIFFWVSLETIHIINMLAWGRVHLICVKVWVERVMVEVLYSPAIDREL